MSFTSATYTAGLDGLGASLTFNKYIADVGGWGVLVGGTYRDAQGLRRPATYSTRAILDSMGGVDSFW